jgi:NAD(P)-dependent dehydrogenase (short-subunit alcohol dehydrogenase family)
MAKIFGAESTVDEVLEGVDLSAKRVLVTGVSAGLGVETVRALAAHGASVVGTARDLDKARHALKEELEQRRDGAMIEPVECDLASLKSVRRAADEIAALRMPFDVVIGNAGVMACPQGKTADGFERQFGTNHLGHFVLVNRLASMIKPGGRVVVLSSAGHQMADVDIDDPNFERTKYHPFTAYGRSKTANVLYAVALDRRLKARGVRATAVHPGGIQTELGRHMTPELMQEMIPRWTQMKGGPVRFKNVPQGAATTAWCGFAAPADAVGARYCEDCHVAEINDDATDRKGVRSYALDPARAEALWRKSEEMVGEKFPLN